MQEKKNQSPRSKPVYSIPRHEHIDDGLEDRFKNAWEVAFQAAKLLRAVCHAEEVRLAGSLLRRERFHEESDIDLLVSNFGMPEAFDSSEIMDRFYPWHIDVIPLKAVPEAKRNYLLSRSVALET